MPSVAPATAIIRDSRSHRAASQPAPMRRQRLPRGTDFRFRGDAAGIAASLAPLHEISIQFRSVRSVPSAKSMVNVHAGKRFRNSLDTGCLPTTPTWRASEAGGEFDPGEKGEMNSLAGCGAGLFRSGSPRAGAKTGSKDKRFPYVPEGGTGLRPPRIIPRRTYTCREIGDVAIKKSVVLKNSVRNHGPRRRVGAPPSAGP